MPVAGVIVSGDDCIEESLVPEDYFKAVEEGSLGWSFHIASHRFYGGGVVLGPK